MGASLREAFAPTLAPVSRHQPCIHGSSSRSARPNVPVEQEEEEKAGAEGAAAATALEPKVFRSCQFLFRLITCLFVCCCFFNTLVICYLG